MCREKQIVPGISVTATGEATVDPLLADVLFNLALQLEGPTGLPVDVEHVVAAIVLAERTGELNSNKPLNAEDPSLVKLLIKHIKIIFTEFNGDIGTEDLA